MRAGSRPISSRHDVLAQVRGDGQLAAVERGVADAGHALVGDDLQRHEVAARAGHDDPGVGDLRTSVHVLLDPGHQLGRVDEAQRQHEQHQHHRGVDARPSRRPTAAPGCRPPTSSSTAPRPGSASRARRSGRSARTCRPCAPAPGSPAASMPGTSSGARIRSEDLPGTGAAHPGGPLDGRVDLLDERGHRQDHERHGRHQVGQHHAGQVPGEAVLVEHGGQRDAVGDRRHQDRQQEQQVEQPPAGEARGGPARTRRARRSAPRSPTTSSDTSSVTMSTGQQPELVPGLRRTSGSSRPPAARWSNQRTPNELTTTDADHAGQVDEEERDARPRSARRPGSPRAGAWRARAGHHPLPPAVEPV